MHCNVTTPKAWKYYFRQKSCIDFKKFIEKTVNHRGTGYYKEATYAAKNFVKSVETGQNVCTS